MPSKLTAVLRAMRAECLVREAETIRDYPPGGERLCAAEAHVREAMLQRTLGTITHEQQHQIFSILHFVMPDDAASLDERPPLDPEEACADGREAE